LYQQAHICNWTAIQEDREYISELGISTQHVSPFAILSLEDAPERHRLRSELYAKQNFKQRPMPLPSRPKTKPSRLRIGYFSADFQDHATMYLMAKVFEAHDPEKFELYAYSFGPDKNDEMRQRLIKAVHVFDDVKMMNDKDIALLAQQDKIDIAVDLKGFTKGSRTGIFAYRAAPVQINYLGYPGTMGANFIDYIIADKVVIPEKHEPSYNENIIHLPYSYQVNDNTRVISECSMTRIEMGLPEQGFVFCCFNQNYKISPTEFDIWMRLLRKVEGSVLWLLKSNKWSEDNLRLEAEKRGISSERLIFAEKKPQAEHLARQRLADLFIDTFNVNAHTTTSDALWAGLPVVTKLGKGFAARVAGSLLSAIDMSELITETEQEYESLILDLATNPERLGAIKLELAANRLSKPLFNTELFTKHLEDGYQRAYQQYFDGKKPEAIYVPEQV
jgi:predicted O-linked N-acetylglucosamine transferase (SPINDLY family)